MSDLGHEQTDKDLKKLESIISKEYGVAAKELENKMLKHYADFDRKDADMKKKLADGLITKTQYENWRIGQVATGKRWEELRDSMTNTLVNADKAAAALIQGNNIKAYGDNMNYGTYEVEHGSKINTGFSLYDVDTVKNLLKEDPKIIPMPKVDIPKDELWNRQKLTSAVMQGILQGESMGGIANRLSSVANMDENAAIRNARTYTTAAENKGRLDSYERAEKLGIKTNKKWIATLDDRTRMEHRHLDNMVVAYNEDFETDGYKISFPGDPSAEPEMIYNCRCTLVADIPGVDYNDKRYDEKLGDMTYEEWKHAKDKEPAAEKPAAETEKEREKRELDAIHQFQQVSYEGISADEKDSLKDFINDNEDVTDQVSRGMVVDQSQIDKWIKDGEISMSDMSSWSTDGTTAAEFANVNRKVDAEDGKRSVIIVSENGLPDSALLPRTNAYSESEVLTLTDKYTILSSEVKDSTGDNKSPTVTIIHVEPKDENSAAKPAAEENNLYSNRPTVDNHIKGVSKKGGARAEWLEDILDVDEADAEAMIDAVESYTKGDYGIVHNNDPAAQDTIDALDEMLHNPNMPIFDGTIYRGVHVDDSDDLSALEKVEAIINSGTWNEPGITSFSSKKDKANQFATGGAYGDETKGLNVLIVNKKNLSGCPIQHLTDQRPEAEVLVPSDIKDRGYKIVSSKIKDQERVVRHWHYDEALGENVDDDPIIFKSKWAIIEVEENDF